MASCCLELAQVGAKLAQVGFKLVPSWLNLDPRSTPGASRRLSWRFLGASRQGPGRHLEPRGPPGGPRGTKMASRWVQNDLKVNPAWVQNQPKTYLKSSKNFQVSDIRSHTSGLRSQRSDTLKLGFSSESLGLSSEHLGFSSEKWALAGLQL